MKTLVSPAVLNGPALNDVVFEAIKCINDLGSLHIEMSEFSMPIDEPALMLSVMDTLKIDLFWHEEYNGVEQSVVEADCTLAGPIREAGEIDAVAADVMTAVYRAVIIYAFGNEVEVENHLLEASDLGSGIDDGKGDMAEPAEVTLKDRRGWMPWHQAASYVGKNVLLRFKSGHIEDATIHLNTDTQAYYYMLFDGSTLDTPVKEFMLYPQRDWTLWHKCHDFAGEQVLLRFQGGHIEDALIKTDSDGALIFELYDQQIITESPVAAMPIPA